MQNVFAFLSGSVLPPESESPNLLWRETLSSLLSNARGRNETSFSLEAANPLSAVLSEVELGSDPVKRLFQVYEALDLRLRQTRDYLEDRMDRAVRADQESIETMVSAAYELRALSEGAGYPHVQRLGEWDAARIAMESCRVVVVHIVPGEELDDTEASSHVHMAHRFQKPVLRIAQDVRRHRHEWDCVQTLEEGAEFIRLMFTTTLRAR